jgi:hypothetical protein
MDGVFHVSVSAAQRCSAAAWQSHAAVCSRLKIFLASVPCAARAARRSYRGDRHNCAFVFRRSVFVLHKRRNSVFVIARDPCEASECDGARGFVAARRLRPSGSLTERSAVVVAFSRTVIRSPPVD